MLETAIRAELGSEGQRAGPGARGEAVLLMRSAAKWEAAIPRRPLGRTDSAVVRVVRQGQTRWERPRAPAAPT
jgi:hypothetical protein